VLLPPSEAKAPGGRGRPLRERLDDGPLAPARRKVLAALAELLAGDRVGAATALHLPASVAEEALRADARVGDAPTIAALRRYTGVVYQGLDAAGLSPAARRLAERQVLIFSGLFGVLRGGDPVPAYRVPAKAVLPGVGLLSAFWRDTLIEAMPGLLGDGPVLDLRSADYAAMWRAPRPLAERIITVRILSPKPAGGHGMISHPSKFGKGRLAAAILERAAAGSPLASVHDVAGAWSACGGRRSEVTGPGRVALYT
jgi:cytoplasmic iron level regulating protein YaaA (DUF328/UPF0246 family)